MDPKNFVEDNFRTGINVKRRFIRRKYILQNERKTIIIIRFTYSDRYMRTVFGAYRNIR